MKFLNNSRVVKAFSRKKREKENIKKYFNSKKIKLLQIWYWVFEDFTKVYYYVVYRVSSNIRYLTSRDYII